MNMNIKVTISKEVILASLAENKALHVKEYEQALEVYFRKLRDRLEELTEDAKLGWTRSDNYVIDLMPPKNEATKYDEFIKMFEIAEEAEFSLPVQDYKALIEDTWNETINRAKLLNSTYLGDY